MMLAAGCVHYANGQDSSARLDLAAAIMARNWDDLTVATLEGMDTSLRRFESSDGCDGAVFLQGSSHDALPTGNRQTTLTLEVALAASASHGGCRERLTVVTLSQRSEAATSAVRFAELMAERFGLDVEAAGVSDSVKREGAFSWSVARESGGYLHRRDLIVRNDDGRWLAQYREFRDRF